MSYEEQMRKNERALVLGGVMGCEKAGVAQEPNALQEENDRLREDIAVLEGQLQKRIEETVKLRSLVFELRATLTEACKWDWRFHRSGCLHKDFGDDKVPASICRRIFEALHRKV